MAVPYTFGSATSAIPLSQLDSNFATAITLGSTALTLGTTTTTVAGLTLTSPVISTISNTGTLTLPTSTDTLVGRATTDTLTNKSISGSTNTLTNIPNSSLTNTTVTIGSTSIALGGTATTVAGLTLTSPTMTTPILGTPTSGTLTNCTGYPTSALSGTINLTSQVTGTLPAANGGTGLTSFTANGVVYASSTSALATGSALQFDGTNLGLGVTPSAWASPVQTALQLKGGASFASWGSYGGAYTVANAFYNGTNWKYLANNLAGLYVNESGVHAWSTAASGSAGNNVSFIQAMTLDTSGRLLVGCTSTDSGAQFRFQYGSGQNGLQLFDNSGASGSTFVIFGINSGGNANIGSIARVGATAAVIYNTTSDYRLKTVTNPVSGQGERIDALKPIDYVWTKDGQKARGFLAHEFQEVYSNSVTGTKDGVDADGKPIYQQMQAATSEVIADLVAEIQSLRKRISTLENK